MAAEIIQISLSRNRDGWFVATSEDLPGLFVAHPDIAQVVADVPVTIKAIYKAEFDLDVDVLDGAYPSAREDAPAGLSWVTIPAHVAAAQMSNAQKTKLGSLAMAMRLLSQEEFDAELRKAGLEPSDTMTLTGRLWRTEDGRFISAPVFDGKIPDSVLDQLLRRIDRLYPPQEDADQATP